MNNVVQVASTLLGYAFSMVQGLFFSSVLAVGILELLPKFDLFSDSGRNQFIILSIIIWGLMGWGLFLRKDKLTRHPS